MREENDASSKVSNSRTIEKIKTESENSVLAKNNGLSNRNKTKPKEVRKSRKRIKSTRCNVNDAAYDTQQQLTIKYTNCK